MVPTTLKQNIHTYLSTPFWQNNPLTTGLRMATAALIAFTLYAAFNWQEGYWSVVTIAAISQSAYKDTFLRSLMRLLGTFVGALIGFGLAVFSHQNIWLIAFSFLIFTAITNYITVQKNVFSYGGIVAGLTTVIVLSSSLMEGQVIQLGWYRSLEVAFGIIVIALVTLLFWTFKKMSGANLLSFSQLFDVLPKQKIVFQFNRNLLIAALKISVASSITLLTWLYFRYPYGFWATVSCFLIMEESFQQTHFKAYLRFLAHVCSALIGAACALIIHHSIWYLLIPLVIAFFICGHLVGSEKSYRSLGNTMAMALAIMLLADPTESGTLYVVTARFLNVIYGIAVALFITKYLFPTKNIAETTV